MPIYEYVCESCEHHFESMQRLSDPPPGECPACQGQGVRKLISAAGFQFKGSGWYLTDYARSSGDASSKSGGGSSESGGSEAA